MAGTTSRYLMAFILLALAASGHAAELNVKKLQRSKWLLVETENFAVLTDAKALQAGEMAQELERFRHFMSLLAGYAQVPMAQKVPVILARNRASFTAMGFPGNISGFYTGSDNQVIFAQAEGFRASSQGRESLGRTIILHELTHLLSHNSALATHHPFWYEEGAAEYFSTYLERDGKIMLGSMAILGDRFYDMLTISGNLAGMDSESVLNMKQSDLAVPRASNPQQYREVSRFYARSMAIVHYLNSSPARRQQLYEFLTLVGQGFAIDEVFAQVFAMSYAEFDELVADYTFGRNMTARVFTIGSGGVEFPPTPYTVTPLAPQAAMETLIAGILTLPADVLAPTDRRELCQDIRESYPGLACQE